MLIGTLTDGKMYYTKEGKVMKAFGCDDFDAIKALQKKVEICCITGDKRGFPIVEKRIKDEMELRLELVPSNAKERWSWIKKEYPEYTIVFMGDGIYDFLCLKKADYSFTVSDSLFHVKKTQKSYLRRQGGNRAVAEACILIDQELNLNCFPDIYDGKMTEFNRTIKA